jgi:hypothetical protein
MRFLISVSLPRTASSAQRQRLSTVLKGLEATRLAPMLWLVNNEGDDPSAAHVVADQLLSIVGPADTAQVIVAPMPNPGTGFGLTDQVARAIGAA